MISQGEKAARRDEVGLAGVAGGAAGNPGFAPGTSSLPDAQWNKLEAHPDPGGEAGPPVSGKSSMSSQIVTSTPRNERLLHPLSLRIMHWINAVAIFIMIGSGWKIYNDDAIFGFLHFPDAVVIGKWAQYGLQWHFFGMWIFVLNGIAYLCYGIASGRFGKSCFRFRFARFSSRSAKRCGFA